MADERSVGELLDELFGFESVAKRQTALEQYDRGELVRKARSRELLGVLRGVEAAEHAARKSAVRAADAPGADACVYRGKAACQYGG